MAMMNPFESVNLPTPQRLTADDFQTTAKALGTAATSVGNYMTEQDNKRADRATAALMEAQNTGDTGYISSIMDYAVNNINDPDKRNGLINSGRSAIETAKLNEYNYGLTEAQKTGNLDAFNALVERAKVDPNISQEKRAALYQTAQTALPQLQQAVDTKQLLGDFTSAQTADSNSLVDAINKASLNQDELNLFEQTPDGFLSPKVLDVSQFNGDKYAYGQALTAQNAAITKLGGFIKTTNSTSADAGKVLQKYIAKAVAEGKSPATIQAAISSFQALHPNMEAVTPTESAQYTAQAAKLDEQAKIAIQAAKDRRAFAEKLLESTISKNVDIPDNKILDAISTVTTDWINLPGDNQKTAKDLILDVKINPSTYGLSKAPTNNEIVLAAQSSITGGFWGDRVFETSDFKKTLKGLIDTRTIDPKQATSALTQQFNDIVSNAATAEQDINTNVNYSKLRLRAGYGDTSAYRQLFDAIQRVGVSNTSNNSSEGSFSSTPTPEQAKNASVSRYSEPNKEVLTLVQRNTSEQLKTEFDKLQNAPVTVDNQKKLRDITAALNFKNKGKGKFILPDPSLLTTEMFHDLLEQGMAYGTISKIDAAKILKDASAVIAERDLKEPKTKSNSPTLSINTPKLTTSKPLAISDSPTILLDAALKRGFRDYDHQSDGTYKKRSSNEKPLTVQQFVDKLNAAKEKVGVKR